MIQSSHLHEPSVVKELGSLVGSQATFFADHPPLSPGGRLCLTPSDRVSVKRIAPPRGADGRGFAPSRGYAAHFRVSQP